MNINIYYGGRGIIEDPTLYVLKLIENVLDELHVKFTRYNLYELKNTITTLPQTLKEADGVIFAASIEWMGIGGYLQQFLDSCWLYGDKSKNQYFIYVPRGNFYNIRRKRCKPDADQCMGTSRR